MKCMHVHICRLLVGLMYAVSLGTFSSRTIGFNPMVNEALQGHQSRLVLPFTVR